MKIKEEVLTDSIIEEIKPLSMNSAREVYADQNILFHIKENWIDWEGMKLRNQAGYTIVYSIREDIEDKMIGYLAFNFNDSQQTPNSYFLCLESMYILPEYRSYKLFKEVLSTAKNKAEQLKCISLDFNVPPYLEKLFLKCGFTHIESRFSIDI